MAVLVNGVIEGQVSPLDRATLYGQSVFETIAVVAGKPALLDLHLSRLETGCKALSIPFDGQRIKSDLDHLLNAIDLSNDRVVRLSATKGEGGRGYLNPSASSPTYIVSDHDYPQYPKDVYSAGAEVGLSEITLAQQPLLAGIKHGNRLEQILARSAWQPHWHEALLLDTSGNVIEGTQSNVLIVNGTHVLTPLLDQCGVEGVMKSWVLEQLKGAGFSCEAVRLSVADVLAADEVLLTNSIIGIWPVKQFQSQRYTQFPTAQRLLKLMHQHEIIPNH